MTPQELKGLQVRLAAAISEFETATSEAKQLQKKAAVLDSTIAKLKKEIATAIKTAAEPTISEHAMLRFMERVYGVEQKTISDIVLTDKMKHLINTFESGRFPIEGYDSVAVVKNRVIVTIENNQ